MAPRWGQTLDFNFRHTPFGDIKLGSIRSVETMLYFPGIIRHHSLRIYGGWQQRESRSRTAYASLVSYPRGYYNRIDDKLLSFEFNYKLPLLYPDISIGPVLYIKRIKANLFFDYAQGDKGPRQYMRSLGTELTADMHVLRFLLPLDIGARFAYRPDNQSVAVEFLFSVNLNSL